MLSFRKFISRPEYVQRPKQILQRISRIGRQTPSVSDVTLPWGAQLTVHTSENIGSGIYHYGIFDKIVPEAIWRLSDPGEMAIEVGANIGQNCSLMSLRVGPSGKVLAFEPHPQIFAELRQNAERWIGLGGCPIQLEEVALGESDGDSMLIVSDEFEHNRGSAAIASEDSAEGIKIRIRRMDSYLANSERVGVCKIDVEGHEQAVIAGATQALKRSAIRDIVYEDFNPQPSDLTSLLQGYGFVIFELHEGWLKPKLVPLSTNKPAKGFSFNFLATLDPERAEQRFGSPGWRCLLNH
jgi:FkbM family methyltransferase